MVFGAGGDRDRGKRPLMGAAAARLADVAIVTDDNPRSEDPAAIRAAVLAACPGGREIGDRARAIAEALNGLGAGDVLAVAGKGHEQGQTIGDTVIPFDDVDVVRRLVGMRRMTAALDRARPAARPPAARWRRRSPPPACRSTRAPSSRATCSSPCRARPATATRFVADALAKGAAGAMVHRDVPDAGHLLLVDDTLAGLHRLGGYARERFTGRLVAVTGSVGKTTTKEMLRTILAAFGRTHAAVASYNNHWGLPLTLARMPPDAAFCVAEIGMNHAGEIAPLARLARPHVAVITAVEKAHIGYLGSIEAIADEKAEILRALEPGGVAVLPADSPLLPRLRAAAGGARVVTFGAAPTADVRLVDLAMDADGSDVVAEVEGERIALSPERARPPHGDERARRTGRRAAPDARRRPHSLARALEGFAPVVGPRRAPADHAAGRHRAAARRKLQRQPRLDARGARGAAPAARAAPHRRARRHAGTRRRRPRRTSRPRRRGRRRRRSPVRLRPADARTVRRGSRGDPCRAHAGIPPRWRRSLRAPSRAGDAILIKGSLGSRMKLVVDALEPTRGGRLMLYDLARPLANQFILFNLFRYITFRSGAACLTALVVSFILGPAVDPLAEVVAAQRPADPQRRSGAASDREDRARPRWAAC